VKWANVARKSSTYDVTLKMSTHPSKKCFFGVHTTRLGESFELFTESVGLPDRRNSHAKPRAIHLVLRESLE